MRHRDSVSSGLSTDVSGPTLIECLSQAYPGLLSSSDKHPLHATVPDDVSQITRVIKLWGEEGVGLIVTTGGTGLSPRDVTPEATASLPGWRRAPGISALLFSAGLSKTPLAALSRGEAGVMVTPSTGRHTLVINLPGSPNAVRQGCAALASILPHALALVCDASGPGGRKLA